MASTRRSVDTIAVADFELRMSADGLGAQFTFASMIHRGFLADSERDDRGHR
jgi:hypothetical protein